MHTPEAAVNALKWNSSVPSDTIRVKVEHGLITLQGQVDWNFRRKAAEDAVRYLAGTKGVINLITLKPTLSFAAIEIKDRIKRTLERNANVEANAIKVDAVGNEAILTGTVRLWSEYDAAESTAGAAPGVWHVNNNLNVLV